MSAAAQACRDTPRGEEGDSFDLTVIGAGSAGFAAAIRAAELGARIALIGHGTLGGTCVNTGCVPSKTLIRAAEAVHQAAAAARFRGVRGRAAVEDWRALVAGKDELVEGLRQAKYRDVLRAHNLISYVDGAARLTDDGVRVNRRSLMAPKTIIATGASPALPHIPGIERVPHLTSTTAMELDRLPGSLVVVGAGYIGCELAQMFARAGAKVTLVDLIRVLPQAEPEVAAALAGYLREEGITIVEGASCRDVRLAPHGVSMTVARNGAERSYVAERLLVATGRRPNTQGLGLEEAGVALGEHGGVRVDEYMQTSRPGVYAAGDVTGRDQFVYMAAYGAKLAAENALNGDRRRYDATAMPSVVFTDPQAASVGLTASEAREKGLDVRTSVLPLDQVPRAVVARDTRGLIKLVAETQTGRLLGAHILAPEGGDGIQAAAFAIRAGMSVRDLAETVFPYLTTVEGLKLAALAFEKDVKKLSCCAG